MHKKRGEEMNIPSILSYEGRTSQTGLAVIKRFPDADIDSYTAFARIGDLLVEDCKPLATPVWNSHKGEIRDTNVWEHLLERRCRLVDIWPGCIQFWFITRRSDPSKIKRICCVKVAKQQCSHFLKQFKAALKPCESTVAALKTFIEDPMQDAALIAPDQIQDDGMYSILEKKTANPNNFTTFALLVPRSRKSSSEEIENTHFTAVSMPAFQSTLSDVQKDFFEKLLETDNLDDVPRLLFVFNRLNEAASVGLLFQGPILDEGDLLTAEMIDEKEIRVVEKAGNTPKQYTTELDQFLLKDFGPLQQGGDFIKHRGDNAWLFACPKLGIYTHGYDEATIEPAFRYYINKIFKLLNRGLKCSAEQRAFFEKHEEAWKQRDADFIEFALVC